MFFGDFPLLWPHYSISIQSTV
uniref:Uncharacterized protein n=1 Tax=Anguilla anguilla TaxID=7936 RepID=A0A0E9UT20_ANGAN